MNEAGVTGDGEPRRATLFVAALVTIGSMIPLIVASIVLFGEEAEDGRLQVAMTLGLTIALVVATTLGFSIDETSASISKNISSAPGTIFVLLAIGALIGSLFLSGPIASVVSYGAEYGFPRILYILVLVIATVLAYSIGSSFTTMPPSGCRSSRWHRRWRSLRTSPTAAAVVGSFTCDALGRISDTFILTTSVVGSNHESTGERC